MKNKILIIEDDPVILENTAEFLKEEGFEVYMAVNGVEGIQKALEIIPDLIICDISMPLKTAMRFVKPYNRFPIQVQYRLFFLRQKYKMMMCGSVCSWEQMIILQNPSIIQICLKVSESDLKNLTAI